MMHTHKDMCVLLCWPTEEPGRWILAPRTLTYQSGWLSVRQVREPADPVHSVLPGLLHQMWALRPRPDSVRHLRAYIHLPPLHWMSAQAWAMVHRRQDHYVAARALTLRRVSLPEDSYLAYRHPRVRRWGPLLPGCVVVVDVPVTRGCPILDWPPPPDAPTPCARRGAPCFRGGTTLLVVAMVHGSAFVVDTSGLFGWVLNCALRHLDEPPGDGESCSYRLLPTLPPVNRG